jgi:hypothetical protein
MIFRVIARTKYGDPSSDILREFPDLKEARTFIEGLGFQEIENTVAIFYYGLPFTDERGRKSHMAGYILEVKQ